MIGTKPEGTWNKAELFEEFTRFYLTPYDERVGIRTQEQFRVAHQLGHKVLATFVKKIKKIPPTLLQGSKFFDEAENFKNYIKELAFSKDGQYKDRELYARLNKWLVEKKEEVIKYEFGATDYLTISAAVIRHLREELERGGGVCPVCNQHQALLSQSYVVAEREHGEDDKVGAVGVSA